MSATEVERSLTLLAGELDWPPTPSFELRLEPRPRPRSVRRPLALAFALLALALGIAFAVPPARSAILRFLHLGGVTIERVERLPPAQERSLREGLGARVTAAEARLRLGFRPLLPPRPPQLYVRDGTLSMLLEQPRLALLTELESSVDVGLLLKKVATAGTRIEPVSIGGARGYWLSGARHVVFGPGLPPRYAGNTLLWQRGGVTLRLEGKLTKAEALALARTIR
jgi:hypothetical protein